MRSSVAGVIGVAVGVVIGGLAVYAGLRLYLTRGMDVDPVCEAKVLIARKPDSDTFEVRPKNVCLFKGHHLTWEVNTPPGDTVEIVFDELDKAFPYDAGNNDNPSPGKYKTTRPKAIDSNPALTVGRWKYKVLWTPAGSNSTTEIDPAVCIRGG